MTGTKKAIAESLKNLLMKKPITKITITDITNDCGVSRMTFYYHFRDIYDLAEWMCEEEARAALATNTTFDTWQQGFVSLLEAIRVNKSFITNLYHSLDQAQIERFLARVTEHLLLEAFDKRAQGLTINEEDKRYAANFYLYGLVGIILKWIQDDMTEEPARIADTAARIMRGKFWPAVEQI